MTTETTTTSPAPVPTDAQTIAVLRAAAAKVRSTAQAAQGANPSWAPVAGQVAGFSAYEHVGLWAPPAALAVANWLDAEAILLAELDPFVSLIDAVIAREGVPTGRLALGRTEQGNIAMRTESTPAAITLAHLILGPDAVATASAAAA